MKDVIDFYDNLPFIVKLILAFPFIDGIAWGIYRVAKGLHKQNIILIIAGILWIFAGFFLFWIIDLITIILHGKPTVLVD